MSKLCSPFFYILVCLLPTLLINLLSMYFLHKIRSIFILAILIISFPSCEKWIDPELGDDPNKALKVPVYLILPSIQTQMAYTLGGADYTTICSAWVHYCFYSARSVGVIGYGNITESDVNSLWKTLYDGCMMDAYLMINSEPYSSYNSVGKILMAYLIGTTTDTFGDVPYREAFQGNANLTPKYDPQETLYQDIHQLLTEAITELESINVSIKDDLIYNGDLSKWIKLAYSLKARYTIHLSNRNPFYANEVLTYIEKGFSSNDDDFTFWFNEDPDENSPIFQFSDQRGDIADGVSYESRLENDNDPRLYIFDAFSGNSSDDFAGLYYGRANGPVELMTYTELMYIAAEAAFATGDLSATKEYLKTAVESSIYKYKDLDGWFAPNSSGYTICEQYNNEAPAWLANKHLEIDAANIDLEYIINQKYISRYLSPESYTDYRRTGYPYLNIYPNASIPKRFPYPSSERLYNPNTPSITKNDLVWWDNND